MRPTPWGHYRRRARAASWTAATLADGDETYYGFGWGVSNRDGVKIVSHSGGQAGTSTHLIIVPASRIAVAAMCNLQGTPVSQLTNEIVNSLVLETSGK